MEGNLSMVSFETNHHLLNIISFDCIYGFVRLKSRKIALFHRFPPLTWFTIFMRLGPLKAAPGCQKSSPSYKFNSLNFDYEKISVITL